MPRQLMFISIFTLFLIPKVSIGDEEARGTLVVPGKEKPFEPRSSKAGSLQLYTPEKNRQKAGSSEVQEFVLTDSTHNITSRLTSPDGRVNIAFFLQGQPILSIDCGKDGKTIQTKYYVISSEKGLRAYVDVDGDGMFDVYIDPNGRRRAIRIDD